MPPKKKGKGKKGAKARSPTLVNGLTIDESTKEQLEDHIAQLREELNRERDERNYFQLERDEITSYWKITERELEVAKAELRKLDKDIEEDEEHHRVELKVYKQKMKHLLCEHQNAISEVKADSLVSVEALHKEQEQVETAIHKNMRSVLVDTQELDIEHLVKELELKHEEEMTETRNNWEKQLLEIKAKYKKKMHFLRTELDNIRKNQTGEREDHCNSHIDALVEDHNRAFNEANLLVSQMQQDVDMNMSLKRQIKDMRMSQKEKEKELVPILQDNKRLAKLLLSVKDQIKEKEKKMRNCIPKGSDNHIERVKKKELDDARAEFQTLEQNFLKIQQEREELYKAQSIQMVQQRVDAKIEMLERKMKSITESLERTQAQLCSVLSAPNMDQTALAGVANEIEQNLDASNDTIKSLQYKKAQISKALKDLHLTFEVKQRAIGVPVEELCAKPFESSHAEKPALFLDIPTQNPLSS